MNLLGSVTAFAEEIQSSLATVFPFDSRSTTDQRAVKVFRKGERYVIRVSEGDGLEDISLLHQGKKVATLLIEYQCAGDHSGQFLAVRKSTFQLSSAINPKFDNVPLLRLDYNHTSTGAPHAHWNVHAERGAMSVLLARCNPYHSGLVPNVHLPVGGIRYRPCLEDFLEMLIREIKFDTMPGWREAICQGREQWRKMQTCAVVRDSPEIAAQVLQNLGYEVTLPKSGHPARNSQMLRCR